MHHPAGQPRALRALLAAVLVAIAALVLLPRAAVAQDCPVLQPDCNAPSTSQRPTSTTVDRSTTSTTEEGSTDSGETSTTERRRTTTTEEVTTTTYTVTTLHNVLIPGDGSAGAESTTTTAPGLITGRSGISDETLILVIVAGLGIVAVVAAILTYRYWSATKPRVVGPPPSRAQRSAFLD